MSLRPWQGAGKGTVTTLVVLALVGPEGFTQVAVSRWSVVSPSSLLRIGFIGKSGAAPAGSGLLYRELEIFGLQDDDFGVIELHCSFIR